MPGHFGFNDLHSFKDYVVWVQLCAPDEFPVEEWAGPDDQMTLDLAFEGLQMGLRMATEEKGGREEFALGRALVDEAHAAYRDGRLRDGFFKLEELQKVLRKVPSR